MPEIVMEFGDIRAVDASDCQSVEDRKPRQLGERRERADRE